MHRAKLQVILLVPKWVFLTLVLNLLSKSRAGSLDVLLCPTLNTHVTSCFGVMHNQKTEILKKDGKI